MNIFKKLTLVLSSFVLTIATIEILLNLFVSDDYFHSGFKFYIHRIDNDLEIPFIQEDLSLMWSLKPGCYKDRCVNEDGFHDQKYSLKKPKDVFRILAIGDSSTYGMGADFDFLYHTRLEKKLNQMSANKVEVINTGVPGYSTEQGLAFYKEHGQQYNPDIVTMYLGVNDTNKVFSRNDYQVMRSDLPTWINRTRILLSEFRIMKMIHKLVNKQNSDTSEPVVRVSQVRLKRNILNLKKLVNRDGAKLIIISPPMKKLSKKDRRYQRIPIYRNIIEQTAKEQNIPIVVINELTERAQNNNDHLFVSLFHPNKIGHKMIFEKLLEKILALNPLKKTSYNESQPHPSSAD